MRKRAAMPSVVTVTATVNGTPRTLTFAPNALLLDVLRDHGLLSVRAGCREQECGSCTVLVDGVPVAACGFPAARLDGKSVLTVEGLERNGELQPLQESFLAAGAVQCGYCTPGMLLAAKALLDRVPHPAEDQIRTALDGNLCRCTGYAAILAAVQAAAEKARD